VRLRVVTIGEVGDVDADVVVVIDVLRAFTTAPWCFERRHEDDLRLALEVDRFASVPVATRPGRLAQLHLI
jgi:hypothetical protein